MYMERQFGKILAGVKNQELERKTAKKQQKSVHMQLPGQLKKDKLNHVSISHIPQEVLWFTKLFLKHGGIIEAKVFSSLYRPSPISAEGLEIPLMLSD